MPFTPLHLGPGLVIKAVAGRHFSLLSFGLAQIAMDLEPLLGMLRGTARLHGPTHTYLAALLIAGLTVWLTPLAGRPLLRRWNRELVFFRLTPLATPECFARGPVLIGALLGTLSHVLLDSFMHADMTPLAPWSDDNPWLSLVSIRALHQFCLATGLAGVVVWLLAAWRGRWTPDRPA